MNADATTNISEHKRSFAGGGVLADGLRLRDWSDSPLGLPEQWPACLQTAVQIMQACPQPMVILWGDQRTTLYNDAAVELLGANHPGALGQPALRAWPEFWRQFGSRIEALMLGRGLVADGEPLPPSPSNGTPGDFSFVPLSDGDEPGGVLCIASTGASGAGSVPRTNDSTADGADAERIKEALRTTEKRYRQLVQSLPAAVYLCDAEGRIQLYNDAAIELWGHSPQIGKAHWCGSYRIFQPDGEELPLDKCPMSQAIREGRSIRGVEIVIERPDGTRRHALAHPEPIRDASGAVAGAVNMLVDITERKQAEAELAAAKDDLALQVTALTRLHDLAMQLAGMPPLQTALDAILDVLVEIHGADYGLVLLADQATGRLRYSSSLGFNDESLRELGEVDPSPTVSACGACFAEKRRVMVDDVEIDGRFDEYRDVARRAGFRAVHCTPILTHGREILGVLSVHFREPREWSRRERQLANLCARHAAEVIEADRSQQALRESEERFTRFMRRLPGLAWIKDEHGRYVFANEAAERAFGRPAAELYGRSDHEVFPPATAEQYRANDEQALVAGGVETIESLEQPDGVHHSLVSKFPIPGRDGAPTLIGGIAIDVTERMQAEKALRDSEARFRAVTINAPVAIFIKDLEGRYTLANPLASEALGQPHGAVGFTDHDLLPAAVADRIRSVDLGVMDSGRAAEQEEIVERPGFYGEFLSVKFPLRDGEGRIVGVCGVAVDVTERKRAQRALRESDQRLRLATQTGKLGVWDWDIVNDRVSWSESLYAIHGVNPEWFTETVGDFAALVHPDDRDVVARSIQEAIERDAPYELEFRALRPDGETIWLFTNAVVLRQKGQAIRMLGATMDITERKRSEMALRDSEERFRTLASHAPVGIFRSEPNGDNVFVNECWCKLAGLMPEQARGQGWTAAIHPEDRSRVLDGWRQALEVGGASAAEFRFQRPDGGVTWVQGNAAPMHDDAGAVAGYIGTIVDIADRKRSEEVLRNSERMYRAIGESIDYGVWVCDEAGRNIYCSDSFLQLVGMTQEECAGSGWLSALHPDDVDQTETAWRQCVQAGLPWDVEHRFRGVDGRWRPVLARGVPVRDDQGKITAWVGINLDISELKQVENELRESEARFRSMADHAPVLIWVNGVGGCQFVNREYLRFVGANQEEVSGMNWANFIHPDDHQGYVGAYLEAFERQGPFEAQVRMRRADGEYRWLSCSGAPRLRADGRFLGYVGCSVDVTEIKQSEEALREADRRKDDFLAMLGHELRNPLAGIVTGAQVLGMLDLAGDAKEMQAVISRQAAYMSQIVDDLLDVSRIARGKLALRQHHVALGRLLQEAVDDYCRGNALAQCSLRLEGPPVEAWAWADPTRLTQALTNIIHNSVKFGDGPNEIVVRASVDAAARRTVIAVSDRGIGMTRETLDRIFQPFNQADVSLERSRGGLGLGLALAKGLVELHGGAIAATSAGLRRGTTITITLPCVDAPTGDEFAAAAPIEAQRVLIIDDRRDAILPLSKMLRMEGHRIASAMDGPAGLAEAAEFEPHIVLCDIGLVGAMNGYDVCRELRRRPATAEAYIVAVTGYGQEEDRRLAREAGFDYHVTKPVSHDQLLDLLARRPRFE